MDTGFLRRSLTDVFIVGVAVLPVTHHHSLSRALLSVSSSQGWSCLRCPIDPRQTCRSWSRIDLGTGVHRELFPCTVQMAANAQWLILNGGSQSSRVTSVRQAERCVPSCWCTRVRGLVRERTVLVLFDQNAAVKTRSSWSLITRDLPFFTGKIFLHVLWEEKVPKMMDSITGFEIEDLVCGCNGKKMLWFYFLR